jgi:TolA-binding protein
VKQAAQKIAVFVLFFAFCSGAWGETNDLGIASTDTLAIRKISIYDAFAFPLRLSDILTTMAKQREEITTPVITVSPEMITAEFEESLSLIQRGREREAKAALKKFIEKYPQSPHVPQARYQIGLLETDVPAAIGELETLVRERPDSSWAAPALWKIAELQFLLGDYKEAIAAYEQYLRVNPQGQFADRAQLQIAYALIKLEEFRPGIAMLRKLSEQSVRYRFNPEISDALAECYINLGETKVAIGELRRILRDFPNYPFIPKIYLNLALCLEDIGDFARSIATYEAVRKAFPRSNEAGLAKIRLNDLRTTPTVQQN